MKLIHRVSIFALVAACSLASHAAGTFSVHTTSHTPLSDIGGVETTVLQVSVPAGSWVVSAKASFVNWTNKDYDRCSLMVGTTPIDGVATMTGELDGLPAVASVTNLATVITSVRSTFKLNCWHDFNVPNQLIDPWARLVVTRAPK